MRDRGPVVKHRNHNKLTGNTKMSGIAHVKRYKKEHNIKHFYNNIDLLASQEKRLKK